MYILIFTFIFNYFLFSQTYSNNSSDLLTNDAIYGRKPANTEVAITGFKSITLGASREETIKAILSDNTMILPKQYMQVGGVDLKSEESDTFVALTENKFYKSGYFIFRDDALYSITITFQPNQIDFLEILSSLNSKYGKGNFIDANTVAWQNSDIKMILERPSTIKYVNINFITSTSDIKIKEKEEKTNNKRQSILEGL